MRKHYGLLTTLVLGTLLLPYISFGGNSTSSVFEVYQLIESTLNLKEATLSTDIPYLTIKEGFEKACPETSINDAKKDLPALNDAWGSSIGTNKDKVLTDRFNTLRDLIVGIKKEKEAEFCKQQYILFSLLQTTQELYSGKKQPVTRKNIITTEKEHNVATSNDGFKFKHDTSGLPESIRSSFSKNTERYLQETLADMLTRHILNAEDIATLNNKIDVTYNQSCEITEGSFHAVKNKATNEVTFKGIKLIISYCSSNDTQQRNERHAKQILSHELGHYIYFFVDKNPSSFSEICWNKGEINCLPSEFVSKYATKSVEEDYAESFAYWYLDASDGKDHGSAPLNEPMNRRERHFERLFEEETEEDDDDDNN